MKLGTSYSNFLQNQKISFIRDKTLPNGKFATSKNGFLAIAPLNTDIRVSGIALPVSKESIGKFKAVAQTLPTVWNWKDVDASDDAVKKYIKQNGLLTPVPNQHLCGSCWAISTASIVSDQFVIGKQLATNPNLSYTYAMMYDTSNNRCFGGNPATLAQFISKEGIASNKCVDASWCDNSELCNYTSATKHFEVDEKTINSLVPNADFGSCYYEVPDRTLFLLDPQIETTDGFQGTLQERIDHVKAHIYQYGPVSGCYIVLTNFKFGDFSKSGGVYLETVNYDSSNPDYFTRNPAAFEGGHAIAVIGWGITEDKVRAKKFDGLDNAGNPTYVEVNEQIPYWYCRNSWGPGWGDKGYFKIAQYPYNYVSQFDMSVPVNVEGQPQPIKLGGFTLFKPADTTTLGNITKNITTVKIGSDIKLLKDEQFYDSPDSLAKFNLNAPSPISGISGKTPFYKSKYFLLIMLFLVFVAIMVGMMFFRRPEIPTVQQANSSTSVAMRPITSVPTKLGMNRRMY